MSHCMHVPVVLVLQSCPGQAKEMAKHIRLMGDG